MFALDIAPIIYITEEDSRDGKTEKTKKTVVVIK
jgi:hypothetical protein